jgi:hypothetical protein
MRSIIQRGMKNLYFVSFHAFVLYSIIDFVNIHAQIPSLDWGFYHRAEPLLSGHPNDYFHATGEFKPYSGIGDFSHQPTHALPKTLFHLYSYDANVTHLMKHPPAILRLQSGKNGQDTRAEHISSAIEFRIGEINHHTIAEEQAGKIENTQVHNQNGVKNNSLILQRGLGFSVQKQGMLGTEEDGMLNVMNMYSQKRTNSQLQSEWMPRVGIGNNRPLEILHLGNTFTFHAGGASRIADNLYYDPDEQCDKKIIPGYSSSISMHRGRIILSNSSLSGLGSVSQNWGDESTLNGIEIDHQIGMSIGKQYPNATLDIMSRTSEPTKNTLTIKNSNHSTLMNLTSDGALGIYNANPTERVHIGERLTLHAGGASIIGDNIYYDSISRALENGQSASLFFSKGTIQLANTSFTKANTSCSYRLDSMDDRTIRGLIIEPIKGLCGIGTKQPKARLEVLAQVQDTIFPAFSIATVANQNYFTVTGQGNVGIGIAQPKQSFHVNGNVMIGNEWNDSPECEISGNRLTVAGAIIAKEILVTTDSWADDVFESNYELITLDSLERFIAVHKHLPNMPSEAEIQDEGIHLASMNSALLRKIEELTLYIIDLKKDIHAMNTIIETLPIND